MRTLAYLDVCTGDTYKEVYANPVSEYSQREHVYLVYLDVEGASLAGVQ